MVEADQRDHARYRVEGSSLHSMSRKRLEQEKGKPIGSTFRRKPGQRPLQHKRKVCGHRITALQQRPDGLKRGTKLKVVGKRIKRLTPGDKKARAECTALPCVCGCSLPTQWAHLETRAYESTRHESWNAVPACEYMHPWMDQGKGRRCRTAMKRMAKELGRRLEHVDVYKLLVDHGYYTELARKRGMER